MGFQSVGILSLEIQSPYIKGGPAQKKSSIISSLWKKCGCCTTPFYWKVELIIIIEILRGFYRFHPYSIFFPKKMFFFKTYSITNKE